jgi:hypothetical protein
VVRDEPAVATAYRTLPGCLAARGVPVVDKAAFVERVDAAVRDATSRAGLAAAQQRLGRVYAQCIPPVEAARVPLRQTIRSRFTERHDEEIRRAQDRPAPELFELSRRYAIPVLFPCP